MNKKGFTLIELLTVIVILGLIIGLAVPKVIGILNEKKETLYNDSIKELERLAASYVTDHPKSLRHDNFLISIDTLCNGKYIECPVLDPRDKSRITGGVVVSHTNGNYTYTYSKSETTIALTLNLDGGSTTQSTEGTHYEGEVIELSNPEKEGYIFSGWFIESGNATLSGNTLILGTTDVTIKAIWNMEVQLTINLDGGSVETNVSGFYISGEVIKLTTPTKKGYVFKRWINVNVNNSTLSNNTIVMGTSDTIIKAEWQEYPMLTVDLSEGIISNNPSGKYEPNSTISLDIPTKEGYQFSHWSVVSGNGVVSVDNRTLTIGTQDITIKANFILLNFTLTFNANGGNVTPSTKTIKYLEEYGELPLPTKTDYIFIGWFTESTGGSEIISTTTITSTSNHTLYAHWVKTETEFAYTGQIQQYDVEISTYYQFEICGAEGGQGYRNTPGLGGCATGEIFLEKGTTLYVGIGEKGKDAIDKTGALGGYNGGGSGGTSGNTTKGGGGGGGATHIATSSGLLSTLSSNKSSVLIAAGGGGGSGWYGNGGAGGGIESSEIVGYSTLASQTSGYEFGQGQTARDGVNIAQGLEGPGGGGGGYYGGLAITSESVYSYGGSGGSGYVGRVLNGVMQNGQHQGHGYAKITIKDASYMPTEYVYSYSVDTNQIFKAFSTGYYQIEICGAEGGKGYIYTPGLGGCSTGEKYLEKGTQLYVVVGGKGNNNLGTTGGVGGYNGGGNGGNSNNTKGGGGGGGGATHVAITNRGVLSNYASNSNELLIVAGGGGGSGHYGNGGAGGGTTSGGVSGYTANQTSGYAFGQGQTARNGISLSNGVEGPGGGGGGYYGGLAVTGSVVSYGGAGGSGYVGGISNGTMQNGQRQGHGYAKITYIGP